jgi:hypothetical protein
LQSRNQQLLFIDGFLQGECGTALAAAAIGGTCMIEGSHVRKIRSAVQIEPKAGHRPLALTEDEEATIVRLIGEGHGSGNYVTQRDVLNIVEVQFGKCLTYRWVHSFLHCLAGAVCQTTLAPQENP